MCFISWLAGVETEVGSIMFTLSVELIASGVAGVKTLTTAKLHVSESARENIYYRHSESSTLCLEWLSEVPGKISGSRIIFNKRLIKVTDFMINSEFLLRFQSEKISEVMDGFVP